MAERGKGKKEKGRKKERQYPCFRLERWAATDNGSRSASVTAVTTVDVLGSITEM